MKIVTHKSLWQILAGIIFSLMMLSNSAYAELPKSAQADKFKLLISKSLKSEDYKDALRYIKMLEALKVKMPDSIIYYKGESYFHVRKWNEATEQLEKYINKTGSSGKYYKEALVVLGKLEREYSWSKNDKIEFGTPLIKAASDGRLALVKYLLDGGSSIDAKNGSSKTALIYACQENHIEVVKELISRGANINIEADSAITVFTFSLRHDDFIMTKILIDAGGDINRQNSINGRTELMGKDLRTIKTLVSLGAKLDIADNDGGTVLHLKNHHREKYFYKKGSVSKEIQPFNELDLLTIKFLIEKDAPLNVKNNKGQTPLDIAIKEKHDSAIVLLKKHGAKTGVEF